METNNWVEEHHIPWIFIYRSIIDIGYCPKRTDSIAELLETGNPWFSIWLLSCGLWYSNLWWYIFLQRWGVFVGYNRHFHHPTWYLWTVAGHYEMNGTEEECNTLICSVKIFLYRAKISITQLRTDICNCLMYVCNCGTAVCNRVMEILKGTKKIFWGYWGKCSVGTHDEAWSSVMALFLPI